ncbi:MAG: protein kinase domain-containing protein [Porticoccaceae bacterium]
MSLNTYPAEIAATLLDLKNHYADFEENNRGKNGFLVFARNSVSNSHVAIKFYAGEPGAARHDEPRLLAAIQSRNVLSILDARTISDEWGYFITPRCFEGDLDDYIGLNPSAHSAIDVALGICSGCSSLHAKGMLHRDLKPANIVISDRSPKIADFGSVRSIDLSTKDAPASRHSILYRPPESFSTGRYSVRGDVYQIGVVTYQLLGGELPYDGMWYLSTSQRKQFERITDDVDRSLFVDSVIRQRAEAGKIINLGSLPGWVDESSRRAIRRMTIPDPLRRLGSVADVAAEFTAMRNRMGNWYWEGVFAKLQNGSGVIELRPTANGSGVYDAYRDSGSGFRKIPKIQSGSISELASTVGK